MSNSFNAANAATYTGPWSRNVAAHLVRRTHAGNSVNEVNRARLAGSASQAADDILQRAVTAVLPENPVWFSRGPSADIDHLYDIQFRMMNQLYAGGLEARMVLFWTNHFAVSYNNMNDLPGKAPGSYVSHMHTYVRLLQQYGLGNYRELVRRVSKNSAMVYYLNNYNNTRLSPNEDFARELLELFTTGRVDAGGNDNYTEQDVAEVARAVTGWRVNDTTFTAFFDPGRHDEDAKTIFGRTGNYDLDGVIDLIFTEKAPEVAWFLSTKIYTMFVSAEPEPAFIATMAQHCQQVDFNIAELLRMVLKSEHFFDERFRGCRIKSPAEVFLGFLRHVELEPTPVLREYIRLSMQNLNEELLRPDTVFGWDGYNPPSSDGLPGHLAWLNTSLLPTRWNNLTDILFGRNDSGTVYNPVRLVEKITDPDNPFSVATSLARHLLAVPLSLSDIRDVEEPFAGDTMYPPDTTGLSSEEINLAKILLGPIPWYEWRTQTTTSGERYYENALLVQLREFLSYLVQLPSYQHY